MVKAIRVFLIIIALISYISLSYFYLSIWMPTAAPRSSPVQDRLERYGQESTRRRQPDRNSTQHPSDSISACLLIKDDNDILDEWLAYHYHTLRLRYVVVAVDPSSRTSPAPILRRWERLTQLHVELWDDTIYMPKTFLENGYYIPLQFITDNVNQSKWQGLQFQDQQQIDEEQLKRDKQRISNHRYRQKVFVAACFRHLKRHRRRLVVHIDTDEYIRINPLVVARRKKAQQRKQKHQQPKMEDVTYRTLQRIRSDPRTHINVNYPCISMPRLLFGAVESRRPTVSPHIASGLFPNRSLFESLRWRFHTNYTDTDRNAQPKVIVDVGQVPLDEEMFGNNKQRKIFSIHRPSKKLCRVIQQLDFSATARFPLTVNHYLGSWERYEARNDSRRNKPYYDLKANVKAGEDTYIMDWVDGFVERHGSDLARQLLPRQASPV